MGNVTGANKDTENPAAKAEGINKARGPRESTTSYILPQAFFWAPDLPKNLQALVLPPSRQERA